jgi:hypothetical protein
MMPTQQPPSSTGDAGASAAPQQPSVPEPFIGYFYGNVSEHGDVSRCPRKSSLFFLTIFNCMIDDYSSILHFALDSNWVMVFGQKLLCSFIRACYKTVM